MANEIEAAAIDGLADVAPASAQADHSSHELCANCATPLKGRWCYHCGQSEEDFHRSAWKLVVEVFEGLFHFDARVWRTLRALFLHPARLTRSYLDGHRAPQVPPLRLFLVVLLAVFIAGSVSRVGEDQRPTSIGRVGDEEYFALSLGALEHLSPEERTKLKDGITKGTLNIYPFKEEWLKARFIHVIDDPERFVFEITQWGERFAFLSLPLAAALLSLLFVFQRRFYLFDHLIFSLHSLSAAGAVLTAGLLLGGYGLRFLPLLFAVPPIHLFCHMRGVYRTSIVGTLVRMLFLAIGSVIGALLLMFGLVLVGLNGMGE
jgi:hypothetical protein